MPRTLALLAIALFAAGCLGPGPYGSEDSVDPSTIPDDGDGRGMSATETVAESVEECRSGGKGGNLCATRTVTVVGGIRNLTSLEVSLEAVNGGIEIVQAPGNGWKLVATLTARGQTEEDALANLDDIEFSWNHRNGRAHVVEAHAFPPDGTGYGGAFQLILPESLVLRVTASTVNGGVEVRANTDAAALETVNGGLTLVGEAQQATLDTVNGGIVAHLTLTKSGRISAETTNGGIELVLVESERHGYAVEGETSNGEVAISLRDGAVSGSEKESRSFRTEGYESRAIQATAVLETTNGDIVVRPS